MRDPASVRVTGPLTPFAEGFRKRLELLGYAPDSQVVHVRLMSHLSCWLAEHDLDGSDLSESVVARFVGDRRKGGYRNARSLRSLQPLMEHLRELGVAPLPVPAPTIGWVEGALADYAAYLTHERGLVAATVVRHKDLVRPFVQARADDGLVDLGSLTAADITGFMLGRSGSASPATVQHTGTALRSLLRFWHLRGLIGSAATAMLRAGASLEEIGQVLRHQHALTTAGYAKVDHEGLRGLARPWPDGDHGHRASASAPTDTTVVHP